MDKPDQINGKESRVWIVPIVAGLILGGTNMTALVMEKAGKLTPVIFLGDLVMIIGMYGIPFGIAAWLLYAKRKSRLPSFAFIFTIIVGGFFFLFSAAESVSGFLADPIDPAFAIGGLIEIATISLPFLIIAWLLWVKPKIGAGLLLAAGIAMAVWMYNGWNRPEEVADWIGPVVLSGVPILLGAYTLITEMLKPGNRHATGKTA